MTSKQVTEANQALTGRSPHEIIEWAVKRFRRGIVMSSSFQMQSLPLLHIVAEIAPELPVIFLDTGYHFPETLAFRDQLVEAWGLNVRIMRAALPRTDFVRRHGAELHRRDPDLCCYINKVEPMERAVEGLEAWISGIRRDQSSARRTIQVIESTGRGTFRVHPMAAWTTRDIWTYVHDHDLPEHPLFAQGYMSIGCAPCTRPAQGEGNERAGRWDGTERTECGLHTVLRAPARAGHLPVLEAPPDAL